MAAQYHPKTLAKTLAYIACHAPAEFGLFWDPDGTMPWKELYWVLQEDPSLRFVRESIIRELTGLGVTLPFVLEGSRIRLSTGAEKPSYPVAENVPERLYLACRRKQYAIRARTWHNPFESPPGPACGDSGAGFAPRAPPRSRTASGGSSCGQGAGRG